MVPNEMILKGNEVNTEKALTSKLISKRRRVTLPQWGTAWLVLFPALIFLTLFMIYPIINTFLSAFIQNYSYSEGAGSFAISQFIAGIVENDNDDLMAFGLSNFNKALGNPTFLKSIGNTAILVIIEVPLTIMVSLLIATFLNSIKVLKGFYQSIFFLPYVTNTIALGLVFNIVFSNSSGGLANVLISKFGGKPINWLSWMSQKVEYNGETLVQAPATKLHQGVVIVLYALWNGLAFKILVFMAGLATIDSQYYNAAKIDGASNFTIWRRITLPLLSPQILYITITSFIGAFKMYTGVMAVYSDVPKVGSSNSTAYYFGGDAGDDWIPVVGWIYKNLDSYKTQPGEASAASLILLAIIMVITAVQFAVSKKRVHY